VSYEPLCIKFIKAIFAVGDDNH